MIRRALRLAAVRGAALAAVLALFPVAASGQTAVPARAFEALPAPQHLPALAPPALDVLPPLAALGLTPLPVAPGSDQGGVLQPRRQTRRVARYGAIAGGIAGLGVGGFMALWCSGTGDSDNCFWAVPLVTGFGIVSGAAAGAIIGAAIPGPGHDGSSPIASGGLTAGVARASITGRGIPGEGEPRPASHTGTLARFNVYAELTPWFGLGPELGIAGFGDAGDVRHIAVSTRFMASGRVAPFSTVHFGAYDSTDASLEYLGGGIGAGVRIHGVAGRRMFVDLEARHSRNAQNIEPMRMWSLGFSGGLYW
jgi:hypothetical protein